MCYTVQGPHVESLINHPVCRPALSIGAEWPLFHHWCLLHVNTSSVCSSFFLLFFLYLRQPKIQPCSSSSSSSLGTMYDSLTCCIQNARKREEGWWLGREQQGQQQWGGWLAAQMQWSRCESIFVFSQAALLWPGQCNVSLTPVAGMSVCSLSAIK